MQDIRRFLVLCAAAAAVATGGTNARDAGIDAFQQGRYSVARRKLAEAAQGGDAKAALFLALTQAAMGDCTRALPALEKAPTGGDATLDRMSKLAACKCYTKAGDLSKSAAVIQELSRRYPHDPDVLYTAAKLYMKAFNDATYAMFERVPASYRVHELSAEVFEVENRYKEAIAEYREALKLNSKAVDVHYRLGRALLLESHAPEAMEQAAREFKAELAVNPEDSASYFQLGQIAQAQGSTNEARHDYEEALNLSPDFGEALLALGKLHTQQKEYSNAIPLLTHATALQPKNEAAHYALLTAYRDSGQLEKAKAEKAILDKLQKTPETEFSNFLKKLDEKPAQQ